MQAALFGLDRVFSAGELNVSVGIPPSLFEAEAVPFVPRRFTVVEYQRMGELGVLTEEDRVELLEGVITPKMVHNPPHGVTLSLLEEALRPLLPSGWFLRVQCPIITDDSAPEPDIAIVRGTARDYLRGHPGPVDVALLVEASDSSLARDRRKARLYARAGVPVYWIVNLVEEQIEVHTQPSGPGESPTYGAIAIHKRGDSTPVIVGDATVGMLPVNDLLP
jgi:Uma2 family endonuclease